MVICEFAGICDDTLHCGGAQPHQECGECGKCVRDPSQECVEFVKEEWVVREFDGKPLYNRRR